MGPPWGYSKSISKVAGRKAALASRGQLPPELAEEPQILPVFGPEAHTCVSLPQEVKANRMTALEAGLKQEQTQPRRMLLTALSTGQAHASHSQPCMLTRAPLHELPLGKGATGCKDQILHQVLSASGLTASDKSQCSRQSSSTCTLPQHTNVTLPSRINYVWRPAPLCGAAPAIPFTQHTSATSRELCSLQMHQTFISALGEKQQRSTSSSSASHSYHSRSSCWHESGC